MFRNVYVKGYDKFPYKNLSGKHILEYTGKIIYYKKTLPDSYNSKTDIVFDCDCEYCVWNKLVKVFKKK